jgi:hypothetical protein
MKTKLTFKSYFLPIFIIVFTVGAVYTLHDLLNDPYYDDKLFPKIFLPSIFVLTFIYLFFGELRTKNIIVEFFNNKIVVRKFFGLQKDSFCNIDISGWKQSHLQSYGGISEFIYLYNLDNKKIIKFSKFYHKNYNEIKDYLKDNFQDLGYENFSYIDEFKEIYK